MLIGFDVLQLDLATLPLTGASALHFGWSCMGSGTLLNMAAAIMEISLNI